MRDKFPHIPQGGPHIVEGKDGKGRHIAVAVLKHGVNITVLMVGAGKTRKEAVADCRQDLDAAMKAYLAERVEEELGVEVISVERVPDA